MCEVAYVVWVAYWPHVFTWFGTCSGGHWVRGYLLLWQHSTVVSCFYYYFLFLNFLFFTSLLVIFTGLFSGFLTGSGASFLICNNVSLLKMVIIIIITLLLVLFDIVTHSLLCKSVIRYLLVIYLVDDFVLVGREGRQRRWLQVNCNGCVVV